MHKLSENIQIMINRVRLERLELICARYGLFGALQFVLTKNRGSENLYHSTEHCLGVALIAYDLAVSEGLTEQGESFVSDVCGLLLGCLFHDFDHAAADINDKVNIKLALRGLAEFKQIYIGMRKHEDRAKIDQMFDTAQSCISVTEFPFVHVPTTSPQKIIRDADLLYATLAPNSMEILDNLRKEIAQKNPQNPEPSLAQFMSDNKKFMEGVTWYTDSGKAMFENVKEYSFKLMDAFIQGERMDKPSLNALDCERNRASS